MYQALFMIEVTLFKYFIIIIKINAVHNFVSFLFTEQWGSSHVDAESNLSRLGSLVHSL